MKKDSIFLIALVAIATFLLIYTPHYRYPFPSHIDEWHHITETLKLQKGECPKGVMGYRIGFQILLLPLSKIANLVAIYKYLPALWAAFSAIVLFYVVYRKTGGQFFTALFAMIFFASIKSNVNITGLWFFTPLSFSIPFIFLYVHFFTEGIESQNKKFILSSLLIMVALIFIHSIAVLFAIPFLLIYALFNFGYIKKEWQFFLAFLAIPIAGILFFKFMTDIPWNFLTKKLIDAMQFRRGWGVLELENSFLELYSLMGYILALVGLILIFIHKKKLKKYLAYVIWPITVLISIFIFRRTGISYLSPYQRNLYYFAISLPMLSAFGLGCILELIKQSVSGMTAAGKKKELSKKIGITFVFLSIIFLTFKSYWYIPQQIDLYKVIDNEDYQALLFLADIPEKSTVMAMPSISTALYPISGHNVVATFFFYGNRKDADKFFYTNDCEVKQNILEKYKVKYVLSKFPIYCGWKLIYDEGDYIYEIE